MYILSFRNEKKKHSENACLKLHQQCTEVRFARFLSGWIYFHQKVNRQNAPLCSVLMLYLAVDCNFLNNMFTAAIFSPDSQNCYNFFLNSKHFQKPYCHCLLNNCNKPHVINFERSVDFR